jgi:uncharacterized protein
MPPRLPAAIVVLALAAMATPFAAFAQDRPLAESPLPVIRVSGEGTAAARPDMAVITLGVVREAETAKEALDANSAAMNDVIAALKAAGVDEKDLQTTGFRVDPRYVYAQQQANGETPPPRIVGYSVSNQVTVRIRFLERLGEILDKVVTLGVNSDGGISFTNAEPGQIIAAARAAAVKDAAARALTLADAAGVTLGPILEISESAGRTRPVDFMAGKRAMAAESAVPIQAGENEYRVGVDVTFEIQR